LDEASFKNLTEQQLANAVGVQGQVFTIVNDESYFYPDMIRGMIVDKTMKMVSCCVICSQCCAMKHDLMKTTLCVLSA
jgi:hypothetical protein